MLACTARAEAVLRPRRPAVRFNSASTAALLTPDSVPRIDWAGSASCVTVGGDLTRLIRCCMAASAAGWRAGACASA